MKEVIEKTSYVEPLSRLIKLDKESVICASGQQETGTLPEYIYEEW